MFNKEEISHEKDRSHIGDFVIINCFVFKEVLAIL